MRWRSTTPLRRVFARSVPGTRIPPGSNEGPRAGFDLAVLCGSSCASPLAPGQQPDYAKSGRVERQRRGKRCDDGIGVQEQAAAEREALALAERLPAEDGDQLRRIAHAGPAFVRSHEHGLRIVVKVNVFVALLREAAREHEARRIRSRRGVVERVAEVT